MINQEPLWWSTTDGDKTVLAMYERHYSSHRYADGRTRKLFMGPGFKRVLRTDSGDAVFGWRKFIDACIDERTGEPQQGINCSIFRNESPHRSSELIRQADAIAYCIWPDSRHYTYVNPSKVRSVNPGFCFIKAGWKRCGTTKGGLLIFEIVKEPPNANETGRRDG